MRNAAEVCKAVPTAAAKNTIGAAGRAWRIFCRAVSVVVPLIPIVASLPHITGHIVETVAVGCETAQRRSVGEHAVLPVRMVALGWA